MARRLHGLTDKAVKEQKAVNRIVRAGRQRRRPPNKRRRWPGGGGRDATASTVGAFALIFKRVNACTITIDGQLSELTVEMGLALAGDAQSKTGALLLKWDTEGDDQADPVVPPYKFLIPEVDVNEGLRFVDCKNPNPAPFKLVDGSPRLVKGDYVRHTLDDVTYEWFELPTFDQAATIIEGTAAAAFAGSGGSITIAVIHQPGHQDDLEVGDTQEVVDPGISFSTPAGGVVFAIREVGETDFTIFQAECTAG